MKMKLNQSIRALILVTAFGMLHASTLAQTTFVGNLDGVSNNSVFDPGASAPLPAQGWVNISGTAQVFDGAGGNGAIIHTLDGPFLNYEIQYDTGVAIQPNMSYSLTFEV